MKYQDKKTGVWYDVMDVKDPPNYLEAPLQACLPMFSSRVTARDTSAKGISGSRYQGLWGILNNFIQVNPDKTISLTAAVLSADSVPGPGPYVKAKLQARRQLQLLHERAYPRQ